MEYKKQLLIKVLTKLKPYRDLAEGILALVESSYVDEQAIDGVIHVIGQSIKKIKKDEDKTKLQKWLEKIQQIKAMEEDERMSEESLDVLLADI
jgi:RPA family protein